MKKKSLKNGKFASLYNNLPFIFKCFICIIIYCVSVLSLRIESTNSIIYVELVGATPMSAL